MSLIDWLLPSSRKSARPAPESSGTARTEAARAPARTTSPGTVQGAVSGSPSSRKSERMARRELLYSVVRQAMVRAGVLTSTYKFKVLSLDGRGREFLVMIDLAAQSGSATAHLTEIEASIAQAAKARYDIVVTAVYWRTHERVVVPPPDVMPDPGPGPLAGANGARFQPIGADEMAAFKKALAEGEARPAVAAAAVAFDGTQVHGPQSYTLLTGFEDTEMPDADPAPALSATQYGDLR